jgi:hypothetical protein
LQSLDYEIIAVAISEYMTLNNYDELFNAPVDRLSFNGYVNSTPKSKHTADIDIKLNPWKKQINIDSKCIFNFINMQVNPVNTELKMHIKIIESLYKFVFCKNIPTNIEPTTPPPINTAPK